MTPKQKETKRKYESARRIYISQNITFEEVAKEVGLPIKGVKKKAQEEGWNLFKASTVQARNELLIDHVYRNIEFYTRVKEVCEQKLIEFADSPKAFKTIQDTYMNAEKRLVELLGIRLECEED